MIFSHWRRVAARHRHWVSPWWIDVYWERTTLFLYKTRFFINLTRSYYETNAHYGEAVSSQLLTREESKPPMAVEINDGSATWSAMIDGYDISLSLSICADFHPEGGRVALGQVLRRLPHLQSVSGTAAAPPRPLQTIAELVFVQVLRHRRTAE